MNPAPSIILFTVIAGAGYGLLFWCGVLRPLGVVVANPALWLVAVGSAVGLISVGLLASTAHLGRPERLWRAVSQWRSSWLSREAVAALFTYVPAGLFFFGLWRGAAEVMLTLFGLLAAAGAVLTVWCTGMIYASLKPIREWHHPLVTPGYLLFAAYSGAVLLAFFATLFGQGAVPAAIAALSGAIALLLKRAYWHSLAQGSPLATMESATGLGFIGPVRALEPPHTETNYLLREMGFRIGRKHAQKLRRIALGAGFVGPALLLASALVTTGPWPVVAAAMAALLAAIGLLVERWLLFAEATHTVTLYYGRG